MNLPDGWQMVFGAPVYGVGDAFVMLSVDCDGDPKACLYADRKFIRDDWDCFFEPWSPEHFAFGWAMLKSHLESRRKQITESYRSKHMTVLQRGDGREWAVMLLGNGPGLTLFGASLTREEAEKVAREHLLAVE